MCVDPVTAIVASTVVSTAASTAGTFISMQGQGQAATAEVAAKSKAAKFNDETARMRAADRLEAAETEVLTSWRAYTEVRGKGRVVAGKSGFAATSFSDIFADNSAEAALERMTIRDNANKDAYYIRRTADAELENVNSENQSIVRSARYNQLGTFIAGAGQVASTVSGGVTQRANLG